jgi:hypothetical protein
MRKLPLWLTFFSLSSLTAETLCEMPKALYLSTKHIEGKGVGYNQGYTSLEAFFSPAYWIDGKLLPLLDARMHIFNDGLSAANAGIGLRYLSARTWGVNAFYDFRQTHKKDYSQISFGLESLGKVWDFRFNGYLPIFHKSTPLYDPHFSHFSGHSLILSNKQQFAFKSLQAEIGTHAIRVRHTPAYLAAGPYYLSTHGKATWGGRGRFGFDFFTYMRAEISSSYDSIFQWISQGQISLTIPFGPKKSRPMRFGSSCAKEKQIARQAIQRIDRNEIIPVDSRTVYTKAINPATNKPYVFWFVDNQSQGHGTYHSRYPTLLQAQNSSKANDVIYVFPGNGTEEGMAEGLILKEGQRLFGSAMKHTIPGLENGSVFSIHIPKESSSRPLITLSETPADSRGVIVLANNCEVAGIHITSLSSLGATKIGAVVGGPVSGAVTQDIGIKNPSIHDNIFEGTYYEAAIFLHNSQNTIEIKNNQISDIQAFEGISVLQDITPSPKSITITNNVLSNLSDGGILIQNAPGMLIKNQTISVKKNTIFSTTSDGILITNQGDIASSTIEKQNIYIISNTVSDVSENGIFVYNSDTINIEKQNVKINHNTVSNSAAGRGIFLDNNGTNMTIDSQYVEINKNKVSDTALEGILFLNYKEVDINSQTVLLNKNQTTDCISGGLEFSNTLSIIAQDQNVTISNNQISTSLNSGIIFQNNSSSISPPSCVLIENNQVDGSTVNGIFIKTSYLVEVNATVNANTVSLTETNSSLAIQTNNNSQACVAITNNIFDQDIVFTALNTSTIFVPPLENNQYEAIVGTYTEVPAGTCNCD